MAQHKITVGGEGDPFLIPVELPQCGANFSIQVHELLAATKPAATNEDIAALLRARCIPPGAADAVPEETLVAVYWQAAGYVSKAAQQGNG